MPKDAIIINNVSKTFRIPHDRKTTLFEHISGLFDGTKGYEEFQALKNINFTVKKGEAIGIIGENGSGKSTLLKIISNILRPSIGSVKVNGKITSFLELGVGFEPNLTARENIYLYGTVMGLSDREIDERLEEILEFSDLKRFEDTKLKNLSSGMQVRLAFSTAIQTDPEILLMDEVLAVGDMEFQQKCLDVFQRYIKEKKTIVFVSHDLSSVRRFCKKSLLLKHGEQVVFGETNEIIDKYVYGLGEKKIEKNADEKKKSEKKQEVSPDGKRRLVNKQVIIADVKFYDKFGKENINFISGDPLTMRIFYETQDIKKEPIFGLGIYNEEGKLCYETNTELEKFEINKTERNSFIDFKIKYLPFWSGKFFVTVRCRDRKFNFFDWKEKEYSFVVLRDPRYSNLADISLYNIPSEWSLTDKENIDIIEA